MAAKEHLSELVRYATDLLRLFWLSLLAIGGGTASLLLSELTALKGLLAIGGTLGTAVLAVVLLRLDGRIRQLLDQLKEV